MRVGNTGIKKFQKTVWQYSKKHWRALPWRKTRDPYHIFVSEVMLQQTQADRVAQFFSEFIRIFPTFEALARAPLSKILRAWQGLGYNRRALYLKRAAEIVFCEYGGALPCSLEKIDALPGIGRNTAAAVMVYAWSEPTVFVETNIRTVFAHHFFPHRKRVRDAQLLRFVSRALYHRNPRAWYEALMDYGTTLKKSVRNVSRLSNRTAPPSFKGSNREVRGAALRLLVNRKKITLRELALTLRDARVPAVISELIEEGFLTKRGEIVSIA